MKGKKIQMPEGLELKELEKGLYLVVEVPFELENGKDYIHAYGDCLVINRIGDEGNSGFTLYGKQTATDFRCSNPKNWREATEEEVKGFFERHLIERYGENWKDVKVKECVRTGITFNNNLENEKQAVKNNIMKELKEKIISLGVARGYLPEYFEDNGDKQFITQYLRLLKEIGEAADEIRAGNKESFEMELGDCLVLLTNLDYIVEVVGVDGDLYELYDGTYRSIHDLESVASFTFQTHYMNELSEEHCLKLAYNKISKRDGVLINGDFFKKGDREYIEYFKNK